MTDRCTGLIWQRDTGNEGTRLSWSGALDYCEGLSLAEQDDWRLPNIRELQSIVNYGTSGPALDTMFFNAAGGQAPGSYWSSTSIADVGQLGNAWYVDFSVGHVHGFGGKTPPGDGNRVRAVCGDTGLLLPATGQNLCYDDADGLISTACEEPPCPYGTFDCDDAPATCPGQDGFYAAGCPMDCRFVDNADGTVTDTCTGLMWQQSTADTDGNQIVDNDDRVFWCEALAYCEDLDFGDDACVIG